MSTQFEDLEFQHTCEGLINNNVADCCSISHTRNLAVASMLISLGKGGIS